MGRDWHTAQGKATAIGYRRIKRGAYGDSRHERVSIRPAIEGRLHNVVEGESFRRVYKTAYTGIKASVVQLIS